MKKYIKPTCRTLQFLSEPLFENTIGNGGETTDDDGGWTRRFDWEEPNPEGSEYFY